MGSLDGMTRRQLIAPALVVALLLAAAWLGTYLAGGTRTVAPHLFYLPVLYAALRFPPPTAVAIAVLAGVAAGPLVPLDVADSIGQPFMNWAARLTAFVAAALLASLLAKRDRDAAARQLETTRARGVADRRQRDFLTHVHHELRTPVTAVYGSLELLKEHGAALGPARTAELREVAFRHAESLCQLVEDLTKEVDRALPGLAVTEDINAWSSPPRRLRPPDAA